MDILTMVVLAAAALVVAGAVVIMVQVRRVAKGVMRVETVAVKKNGVVIRKNAIIFAAMGIGAFVLTLGFAGWIVHQLIQEAGSVSQVAELTLGDVWLQLLGLLSVGTLGTMVVTQSFALSATMLAPEPDPNPLAKPLDTALGMLGDRFNPNQFAGIPESNPMPLPGPSRAEVRSREEDEAFYNALEIVRAVDGNYAEKLSDYLVDNQLSKLKKFEEDTNNEGHDDEPGA